MSALLPKLAAGDQRPDAAAAGGLAQLEADERSVGGGDPRPGSRQESARVRRMLGGNAERLHSGGARYSATAPSPIPERLND